MLNKGQARVLQTLIDYINDNYKPENKRKLLFDELSTSKDSICLATSTDSAPTEKLADVTGNYYAGTLTVNIVLRIMKNAKGIDDLTAISECDDLYSFILSNYKNITADDFYIDKITQLSGAKLDSVYSGGVKDYKGIFTISYERYGG